MGVADFDRWYFGVGERESGHYWRTVTESWRTQLLDEASERNPWGYLCDGRLQPQGKQRNAEGPCVLHRKDGWTAIAWWDRSGPDKRPGCCSAFGMRGDHDFDAMVTAFRESFPWAASRMGFELHLDTTVHWPFEAGRRAP